MKSSASNYEEICGITNNQSNLEPIYETGEPSNEVYEEIRKSSNSEKIYSFPQNSEDFYSQDVNIDENRTRSIENCNKSYDIYAKANE